ncbi:hypothetical protein [Fluviicola sp.]|uniref:hypothetical protein n=1 Tax=Fluviicola sp. TaxID=1917219 RepID=UPI0031D8A615
MDKQRELPEIEIDGRRWIVDVNGFQLIDRENPENKMKAAEMRYSENGYTFLYDRASRNLISDFMTDYKVEISREQIKSGMLYIQIPNFAVMDAIGVAQRYGCTNQALEAGNNLDYLILEDRNLKIDLGAMPQVIEDGIFSENAVPGKMSTEIRLEDFLFRKLQIYAGITDRPRAIDNRAENTVPKIRNDLVVTSAWSGPAKNRYLSDNQHVHRTRRKLGR